MNLRYKITENTSVIIGVLMLLGSALPGIWKPIIVTLLFVIFIQDLINKRFLFKIYFSDIVLVCFSIFILMKGLLLQDWWLTYSIYIFSLVVFKISLQNTIRHTLYFDKVVKLYLLFCFLQVLIIQFLIITNTVDPDLLRLFINSITSSEMQFLGGKPLMLGGDFQSIWLPSFILIPVAFLYLEDKKLTTFHSYFFVFVILLFSGYRLGLFIVLGSLFLKSYWRFTVKFKIVKLFILFLTFSPLILLTFVTAGFFNGYEFSLEQGFIVRLGHVLGMVDQKIDSDIFGFLFGGLSEFFLSRTNGGVLIPTQEISVLEPFRLYGLIGHFFWITYLFAVNHELRLSKGCTFIYFTLLITFSSNPSILSFGSFLFIAALQFRANQELRLKSDEMKKYIID
jgi:hypothetical protein